MGIVTKFDIDGIETDCYIRIVIAEASRFSSPPGMKGGIGGSEPQKFWLHIIYNVYKYEGQTPTADAVPLGSGGQTVPYNEDDNMPIIKFAYQWLKDNPRFKNGIDL